MKNTIFILLILVFTGAYSQTYKYHKFEILGDNLNTAKLNYCRFKRENTYSAVKMNLKIDQTLPIGNVYLVYYDGETHYLKVRLTSNSSINDYDFQKTWNNSTQAISFNCDSDGDGVPDSQDNCPNDAGPSSNNGCPGNPDLVLDLENTLVFSDCSRFTCYPILSELGSTRHLLNSNVSAITFDIAIKNEGTVNSQPTNVALYLSSNKTLEKTGTNKDNKLKSIPLGVINKGSYSTIDAGLYTNMELSGIFGNPYILIVLDDDELNTEGNESNNITPVGISINYSTNLMFKLSSISGNKEVKPYLINIYNFSGQKILSKKVSGTAEENAIVQELPKNGIYIIKSNNETRKVYVGHN